MTIPAKAPSGRSRRRERKKDQVPASWVRIGAAMCSPVRAVSACARKVSFRAMLSGRSRGSALRTRSPRSFVAAIWLRLGSRLAVSTICVMVGVTRP